MWNIFISEWSKTTQDKNQEHTLTIYTSTRVSTGNLSFVDFPFSSRIQIPGLTTSLSSNLEGNIIVLVIHMYYKLLNHDVIVFSCTGFIYLVISRLIPDQIYCDQIYS